MKAENIEKPIDCPPFRVPLAVFPANEPKAVIIVVPAMGTTARFYKPFAENLVLRGFKVLSPELPGTGASFPRPSWKLDYGYRLLFLDYLPLIIDRARKACPGIPVVVAGHSLGAHIATLAVAAGTIEIDALLTIAGGNIHYRNWAGTAALKVLFAAGLFSFLTRILGYMPGQYVGFGGPQARTLIREWAKIIRTGSFSHIADVSGYEGNIPMLCVGIEGDTFAPKKSVSMLAGILHGEVEMMHGPLKGNPHSSWAREPAEVVEIMNRWLYDKEVLHGD